MKSCKFSRKIKYVFLLGALLISMCFGMVAEAADVAEASSGLTSEAVYNEDVVELEVYVTVAPEEMAPYKEMFEARYPHIKVNYVFLDNYDKTALDKIRSGDCADVLYIPAGILDTEVAQYFCMLGLEGILSQKYNYLDSANRTGNMIYGIPSSAYATGFLYNKEVFNKAGITQLPTTPEEFLEDLRYIRDYTDAIPFYTNYGAKWAVSVWETFPYIEMTGSADYKYNKLVAIENPYNPNSTHWTVYKLLYDIVDEGLCEEDFNAISWEKSKAMLNNGEIGCIAIGSWAVSQIKNAGEHGDNIGFMPFPNNIDGVQYATINTDYNYGVYRSGEHIEEAKLYVDFMLNESGFALDNECISIVKSDPYPDSFSEIKDVTFLSWEVAYSENNRIYEALSSKLNLSSGDEQIRIIEAAADIKKETFAGVLQDWNTRWESSRTEEMKVVIQDVQPDVEVNEVESQLTLEKYAFDMSATEWEYWESLDGLKIGYLRNHAPFQYEDEEGVFQGVAAELWSIIQEQTSVNLEYIPYDNYSELLGALDKQEIDVIAGIEDMESMDNSIRLSKEYLSYSNVIVKNLNTDIDNISSKRVAAVEGNESDYFAGLTDVIYGKTIAENIEQVNNLKADYTITNYYCANYCAKGGNYNNIEIIPITSKSSMHIGFRKDADTRLIAVCNKCIYAVSDGTMEMLLLEQMSSQMQHITVRQLIEMYPIHCIAILTVVFLIVVLVIFWISREKTKNAKKHELDAQRFRILADLADEYVFEYNAEKNQLIFDKKFEQIFGFSGNVNLSKYASDNKELNQFIEQFNILKNQEDAKTKEFLFKHKDSTSVWYRMIASKIHVDNKLHQMIGKVSNIQKEMEERKEILDKAERDPLTGLFNRDGLQSVFGRLHNKENSNAHYALAIIDFDNFKAVNDTLGHAGGDEALKCLAKHMTEIIGDAGIAVRFGGDEFMIYIPSVTNIEETEEMLKRLVTVMDCDIEYQNKKKHISISMGAVCANNTVEYSEVFEQADKVLYAVKSAGKNNCKLEKYKF